MTTAATSFYITGGTLRQDARSYVERQADKDLYEGLLRGEYCYVLHARQMGKSSLMVHTTTRLREEGVAVLNLDLTRLGQNLTVEQWYDGLLGHIGQQLDLEDELEAYWLAQERLSPLQRFLGALQEVLLRQVSGRIVLFLDEIDAVRSLSFSTDEFFAAIRECYNRRTQDPQFERLTFCLLGVATPSDLIQDTRTTPFNIGRRIELTDFSAVEAAPLASGLGRDEPTNRKLLERVLYWTGGHPYLTQRLCRAVADDASVADAAGVDRHCEELFLSRVAREKDDNLLFVRERLVRNETDVAGLLDLYGRVWRGKRVAPDDTNQLVSLLRLSGITRVEDGWLRVRNRIYERVFDREWITTHMPDAELRRQKAAFRRGLWRATAISGVVLAAMAGLALMAVNQAWRANQQRHLADQERRMADQQRLEARANLYASQMNLAQRVWDDGNMARALELLDAWRPRPGQEDLRGWEWRYLWRLCRDGSRLTLPTGGGIYAFSPAAGPHRGSRLFASTSWGSNEIRLYDLSSRRKVAALHGHHGWVRALSFSPDGKVLACGSGHGPIELWDVASLRVITTLRGHKGSTERVVFSADGKRIASRGSDNTVKPWDVGTRKLLASFPLQPGIGGLALSRDGRTLAASGDVATARGTLSLIKLWDIRTRREIATLSGHMAFITTLAFSPDDSLLASGSEDSTIGLWRLTSTRAAGRRGFLKGHAGNVYSVAFSPDGKTLASAAEDSTVRLWDVATRQAVTILKGHKGEVGAVAFWPDSRTVASGSSDGTMKLWEQERSDAGGAKSEDAIFRSHEQFINCVAFSADGKMVASEGSDGIVKLWDPTTLQVLTVLPKQGDQVPCVAFSPDGRFLASGSTDHIVRLWDLAATRRAGASLRWVRPPLVWRPVATFKGFAGFPRAGLVFSPDSKTLAVACRDRAVRLWDIASHRQVAVLKTHQKSSPNWIALTPDGRTLAVSGWDDPIELWDLRSRRAVATVGQGRALAISPDNKTLAIIAGTVTLWDLTTRRARATLKGSASARAVTLAFSPDGRMVAAGCGDSTIKVWSLAISQEVASLKGHTGYVNAVAFSPDGNTLASGGVDSTVRLWRAGTFQEADPLQVVASTSSRMVRLQWQPLSWATGYNIYRGPLEAKHDRLAKLNTQPVVGDSFTDHGPGLVDGRALAYAIAPLYRDAAGRTLEGPRTTLHAAPVAVPSGWMGHSINEGTRPGLVIGDLRTGLAGPILLEGSGKDIWGSADGCYFLSQPVTGDFQITVKAITRPSTTHESAKAGLMLRESLDPGARNAHLVVTPLRGMEWQWRATANDLTESKEVIEDAGLRLPLLLRLARHGNTITAEYSMDNGRSFRPADDPLSFEPPLPRMIYAGLATTSHDPMTTAEAKFADLEVRRR